MAGLTVELRRASHHLHAAAPHAGSLRPQIREDLHDPAGLGKESMTRCATWKRGLEHGKASKHLYERNHGKALTHLKVCTMTIKEFEMVI